MSANYQAMSKYLFTKYLKSGDLYKQFLSVDPALSMIAKNSNSGNSKGKSITYAMAVGRSTSYSDNFSAAQDQAKDSSTSNDLKRQEVVVPFDQDIYSVGRVEKKAIYATKEGAGAFVDAVEDETKMIIDSLKSKLSADFWRDGSGVIGTAGATANNTTSSFVLKDKSDLWYFEVGMQFVIAGSTNTKRYVTKIDRKAGKITFSSALASAVTNNTKMYFPANSATKGAGAFDGVAKIITDQNLSTAYRGIDRSIDSLRLAGLVHSASAYDATNNKQPILRAITQVCNGIGKFYRNTEGKLKNMPRSVYLAPSAWQALADEYGTKTELRRIKSTDLKDGIEGFEGLELWVGGQLVRVWACPALNGYKAHVLDIDSWGFKWLGQSKNEFVGFDKMTNKTYFKDVDNAPEIEFRMMLFPILYCKYPGLNGTIDLSAVSTQIDRYTI